MKAFIDALGKIAHETFPSMTADTVKDRVFRPRCGSRKGYEQDLCQAELG